MDDTLTRALNPVSISSMATKLSGVKSTRIPFLLLRRMTFSELR
jgi:hypothetical protein